MKKLIWKIKVVYWLFKLSDTRSISFAWEYAGILHDSYRTGYFLKDENWDAKDALLEDMSYWD